MGLSPDFVRTVCHSSLDTIPGPEGKSEGTYIVEMGLFLDIYIYTYGCQIKEIDTKRLGIKIYNPHMFLYLHKCLNLKYIYKSRKSIVICFQDTTKK